jgi:glycosyltransferase involved in cell wall biosynthesis
MEANPLINRMTFYKAEAVRLNKPGKVIWLASWYPSSTEPYNGDFIQRHAEAVARVIPLTVIHTIHDPNSVVPVRYEVRESDKLTEILVYFKHSGNLKSIPSRISYNRKFYFFTMILLSKLFGFYGHPACLHVHVPMKMGRIAMWAARKWKLPYFVSEHSGAYLPEAKDSYQHRNFIYRYNVKRIFKKARSVSNVSRSLTNIIQHIAEREDVLVIRNVADRAIFFYRPIERSVFTFIHVSTLKEEKNIDGMLNAFKRLDASGQHFHLYLVGGDPDKLKNISLKMGNASWLTMYGMVEHGKVASLMQQAHCMVMFSRNENFPCVIVEALSCGLPVVTSDAGGCPEAIDASNGLVVARGDEDALFSALYLMITQYDTYNRQKIAADAASCYSYERVANDFLNMYRTSGIQI